MHQKDSKTPSRKFKTFELPDQPLKCYSKLDPQSHYRRFLLHWLLGRARVVGVQYLIEWWKVENYNAKIQKQEKYKKRLKVVECSKFKFCLTSKEILAEMSGVGGKFC